jgi:hypothetical protein
MVSPPTHVLTVVLGTLGAQNAPKQKAGLGIFLKFQDLHQCLESPKCPDILFEHLKLFLFPFIIRHLIRGRKVRLKSKLWWISNFHGF